MYPRLSFWLGTNSQYWWTQHGIQMLREKAKNRSQTGYMHLPRGSIGKMRYHVHCSQLHGKLTWFWCIDNCLQNNGTSHLQIHGCKGFNEYEDITHTWVDTFRWNTTWLIALGIPSTCGISGVPKCTELPIQVIFASQREHTWIWWSFFWWITSTVK